MTNSTNTRIRKYVAGGILSAAALFGGALGSAGAGFAAPADGWDPIAPAIDAPAFTPIAPAPAAPTAPAAPALRAPAAPVAPALRAPAARVAPAHKAPAANTPGQTSDRSSDNGPSSTGRSR